MSDIDTAAVDGLKVLDPKRPIGEAAKVRRTYTRFPKGNHMQEVTEYLVRARQCREMIERALPGQRQALEELALTWEKLAEARKRSVQSDSQPSGAEGTSNL